MMCIFILGMVSNFNIFRKVKIQHGRQEIAVIGIKIGDRSVKRCTDVQNNTLNIFRFSTVVNFNSTATVARQHFFSLATST